MLLDELQIELTRSGIAELGDRCVHLGKICLPTKLTSLLLCVLLVDC